MENRRVSDTLQENMEVGGRPWWNLGRKGEDDKKDSSEDSSLGDSEIHGESDWRDGE